MRTLTANIIRGIALEAIAGTPLPEGMTEQDKVEAYVSGNLQFFAPIHTERVNRLESAIRLTAEKWIDCECPVDIKQSKREVWIYTPIRPLKVRYDDYALGLAQPEAVSE